MGLACDVSQNLEVVPDWLARPGLAAAAIVSPSELGHTKSIKGLAFISRSTASQSDIRDPGVRLLPRGLGLSAPGLLAS